MWLRSVGVPNTVEIASNPRIINHIKKSCGDMRRLDFSLLCHDCNNRE